MKYEFLEFCKRGIYTLYSWVAYRGGGGGGGGLDDLDVIPPFVDRKNYL